MIENMDKQKQAFLMEIVQIQKQMNSAAQQVKIYDSQIYMLKRNIKKNELTLKEIDNLKNARAVYVPLGKAFLAKPHDAIKKEFNQTNKRHEHDIKEFEKNKLYYEERRRQKQKIVREGVEKIMRK